MLAKKNNNKKHPKYLNMYWKIFFCNTILSFNHWQHFGFLKSKCWKQQRMQYASYSLRDGPDKLGCKSLCPKTEIQSNWHINTQQESTWTALAVLQSRVDSKTDDIFCGALGIRVVCYPPSFSTSALKMSLRSCHQMCSPPTFITKNVILNT